MSLLLAGVSLCIAAHQPMPVEDFENGAAERWSFSNGPEFPGATGTFGVLPDAARDGSAGGRLSFDFTKGGAYVQCTTALPTQPALDAVDLWIRKPAPNKMTVRAVDETGQTFQKDFNLTTTGWQRVRIRLSGWGFHWGGRNDGVFHGQATALGILVNQGGAATGHVDIDGIVGLPNTDSSAEQPPASYVVTTFADDQMGFQVSGGPAGTTSRSNGAVHYDLSQGARSLAFSSDTALLGSPREARLKVRSDGSGYEARLYLYSHFQCFRTSLGTLDREGDIELVADLTGVGRWERPWGPDEGGVGFPLRLGQVELVKKDGGPATGSVPFEELSVTTELPAPNAPLFAHAMSTSTDDEVQFALTVRCVSEMPAQATVHTVIRDWAGRTVAQREVSRMLPAGGIPATFAVTQPTDGRSALEAEFTVTAPGLRTERALATWAAPMPDPGSPAPDPSSPWGMGLYLYRYGGDARGLAEMDKAAALAQAAGIKWTREEMSWGRIEPRNGEFDWSFYDCVVDTATRHGISVYGLIGYWSPWTKPFTEEGIADYCGYAQALVRRYGDRVKHWEIWNEPNIFFWDGPKEIYFELLKRAYAAIKEVDPDAVVFGCSTAGIDTWFVRKTLESGAPLDGLTIHPYRSTLDDEGFMGELRDVAGLVAGKPVWITEMGWPTQVGGATEREQAGLLARAYVGAIASGAVQNISWYDFRDDGGNPYYNEHRFGVVRNDLSPKPGYRAAAAVARTIGARRPSAVEKWDGDVLACRFGDGEDQVVVVWALEADQAVALYGAGNAIDVIDLMGDPVPTASVGGVCVLGLRHGSPVFIRTGGSTIRGRPAGLQLSMDADAVHPGGTAVVTLETGEGDIGDVVLDWYAPPGISVQDISAGKWRLRASGDATPGVYTVPVSVKLASGEVLLTVTVPIVPEVVEV